MSELSLRSDDLYHVILIIYTTFLCWLVLTAAAEQGWCRLGSRYHDNASRGNSDIQPLA